MRHAYRKKRQQLNPLVFIIPAVVCGALLIWHFLASGAGDSKGDPEVAIKSETLEGIGIESIIEDDGAKVAVHYPKTANETVNEKLLKFAQKSIGGFKSDLAEYGGSETNELYITFKVYRFNKDIVSFKFDKYTSSNDSAHGKNELTTMTFDLSNAKQYKLSELFDDDEYLQILSTITYDGLRNDEAYRDNTDMLEQLKSGTAAKAENFSRFVLDGAKLVIFFSEYQIGSKNIGIGNFDIKLSDLEGALSETFNPNSSNATSGESTKEPSDSAETEAPDPEPAPIDTGDLAGKKLIALTFDDGPHDTLTPKLLDALKANGAKATFFVLGSRVQYYPDVVKRAYDEGHQVASHTYNHKDLTTLSLSGLRAEINDTNAAIKKATGAKPTAMRPPYGSFNDTVRKNAGMSVIIWSVDPEDWKYLNADTVYKSVVGAARDGSIILLHDIHPTSVEAAIRIIPKLQAKGYTLVTVDELIEARGKRVDGKVYYSMYP